MNDDRWHGEENEEEFQNSTLDPVPIPKKYEKALDELKEKASKACKCWYKPWTWFN